MEKIELKDIDFSLNYELQMPTTNGFIYTCDDTRIKILTGLYEEDKQMLLDKFYALEKSDIPNIILPDQLIINNGELEGYVTKYPANSTMIGKRFIEGQFIDIHELIYAIKQASLVLRKLHEQELICQNATLDNFVIDVSGNVFFSSVEGCKYLDYNYPYTSKLLKSFLVDYRQEKNFDITKDTDKLSIILSTLYLFYLREIKDISQRLYKRTSKKVQSLAQMEDLFKSLKNKKSVITNLPYVDELLEMDDCGYLNREEQFSLICRVLKKLS